MISPQQREKMMKAYMQEPVYVAAVMLRCVAGLLIICGLVFVGAGAEGVDGNSSQPKGYGNTTASALIVTNADAQVRVGLLGPCAPKGDNLANSRSMIVSSQELRAMQLAKGPC